MHQYDRNIAIVAYGSVDDVLKDMLKGRFEIVLSEQTDREPVYRGMIPVGDYPPWELSLKQEQQRTDSNSDGQGHDKRAVQEKGGQECQSNSRYCHELDC